MTKRIFEDDGDDEYEPVWPSGLCATSQGGETSQAYNSSLRNLSRYYRVLPALNEDVPTPQ
jgi:hypothetical protein